MKTYVYHMRHPMDHGVGAGEGTPSVQGFYVYMTDDSNELFDVAGPFDDEYDAEMAATRAEEWAA